MLEEIIRLYSEVKGIYGYRRMTLNVNSRLKRNYNHKRIYRLMKSVHMQAVIRRKKKHYVMSEPRITAENVLNRAFTANRPNEKWLTDVTEFKLINGKKAYLSAILDLHDKSIVAYALGQSNNNQLVFDTFDRAVRANPSAPLCFTVTEATNTPTGSSKQSWTASMQRRVCHDPAAASTTALWRVSGGFSNLKCTTSSNFIPLRN